MPSLRASLLGQLAGPLQLPDALRVVSALRRMGSHSPSEPLLRVAQLRRSGKYTVTYDTAFPEVLRLCATVDGRPESARPWLTPEARDAYLQLHEEGFAHSAEAWIDGRLVGGEMGVAINGYYSADSTFHLEPNAAKVAFADLLEHLAARGFLLYDCQELSRATTPFGAYTVPRAEYQSLLRTALDADVRFS